MTEIETKLDSEHEVTGQMPYWIKIRYSIHPEEGIPKRQPFKSDDHVPTLRAIPAKLSEATFECTCGHVMEGYEEFQEHVHELSKEYSDGDSS